MFKSYGLPVTILAAAIFTIGSMGAAEGGEVTFQVETGCYEVGDTVSFLFGNGLNDTIWTPHDPPWSVWDLAGDTLVYPSLVLFVISPVDTGETVTYTWNQIDHLFNAVSTGSYRVQISYSEALEPWSLVSLADTFEIKQTCETTATEVSAWSSIKQLFR